ncbi:hypothetical protein PFNF54_03566 [Plasmodium falciparum NF54]|uniref:Uncharacterized protein n=1 Tax=Plasmodium falciparum (isolate NF54) TaxID=5843 RepID=W7JRV0_PLAFO|nr:hypothetical protein PFNF54_03566 [Plasmodium falciparum NF54]
MDKYENIIKTINTIKSENINIEINIQKTEEIYNILTIYQDNHIKDEQKDKLFSLYPLYLNMLNLAFFNDNLMFAIKQEFYKNTKEKIILFEEKVKNILEMFHSSGPSSQNIDLNEANSDTETLKKYCHIIYQDLLTFNDIDKTIIEVVTTKNNNFNLKNGIKINGIDTYFMLKEMIKSSLKENIMTSLKNYYNNNIILNIIINDISIVSCVVIKVILTEEVKEIMQRKNLEYTQSVLNKYKDMI